MRLDLYTAEDRAKEALSAYRKEQLLRYNFWNLSGSLVVGLLIILTLNTTLPKQMGIIKAYGNCFYGQNIFDANFGRNVCKYNSKFVYESGIVNISKADNLKIVILSTFLGRPASIGIVLAAIFWLFGQFSVKPVAMYQGAIFGIVGAGIAYLALYILIGLFGTTESIKLEVTTGGSILVWCAVFIYGLLGGFLIR